MFFGNVNFPGGVAAWLPSLVYLVGQCMLETRGKVASASAAASQGPVNLTGSEQPRQSAPRPRPGSLEALMHA
eukprot:1547130-Pleurochrysis_carterae.AAC.1